MPPPPTWGRGSWYKSRPASQVIAASNDDTDSRTFQGSVPPQKPRPATGFIPRQPVLRTAPLNAKIAAHPEDFPRWTVSVHSTAGCVNALLGPKAKRAIEGCLIPESDIAQFSRTLPRLQTRNGCSLYQLRHPPSPQHPPFHTPQSDNSYNPSSRHQDAPLPPSSATPPTLSALQHPITHHRHSIPHSRATAGTPTNTHPPHPATTT
jgi:hypothetical protein